MGLSENIKKERVRDLPYRDAAMLGEDASIASAIEVMRAKRIGCAFVVDDKGRPLGFFTERKVIELLVQGYTNLDDIPLSEHLDETWFSVNQDAPLMDAVDAIQRRGARFLCVTDDDSRVVALTGQKGLAEYVADHFPNLVTVEQVGGTPGLDREGA